MYKIAVAAILRKHGTWIESSEFIKLIAKKRGVQDRQAYNILKEAVDNKSSQFEKEIIRHVFSDRTVIYGLPEFGPPIMEKEKASANLGFFGWLDRRAERKFSEKKYEDARLDKDIKELEEECEKLVEEIVSEED